MTKIWLFVALTLFAQITFSRDPITDEKLTQIIEEFQYTSVYETLKEELDSSSRARCQIYLIQLKTEYPGMIEPLIVDAKMYLPNPDRQSAPVPFVTMIPPFGGENMLDRKMAKTFCSEYGIAAMIVKNDFTGIQDGATPPPEDHDQAILRAMAGVKASVAFAKNHEHLNGEKLGIFGVSLGGFLGSFAFTTQTDLAAGFFIVTGGDSPYLLAHSEQEDVARVRRERMAEHNFQTREEYEAWLRLYLTYDPMDTARAVPTEVIQMVISTNDTHVATSKQNELHLAFGEPEAYYFNSGHVGTVIDTLLWAGNRRSIANFFEERFALDNPRVSFASQWLNRFELSQVAL